MFRFTRGSNCILQPVFALKAVQHIQTKFLNCFLNLFHGWETGHVEQAKSKLRTWFLDAFKVRIDWDYLGRFADRKGRHPAVRMKCSPELNFPQGQRMCCQFSLLSCRQAKQISSLHVRGAQYPQNVQRLPCSELGQSKTHQINLISHGMQSTCTY